VTKLALEKMGVWPVTEPERKQLVELDEFEAGFPKMTLTHLYDVIKEIASLFDDKGATPPYLETEIFLTKRT
jgi:hypothetical protein